MKSFHIWDFPPDIYILLKNETKYKLFKYLYSEFGSRKSLARFLDLDPSTLREYHIGFSDKDGKKWVQYLPIKFFKMIKPYLTNQLVKEIEQSVLAYRPRAGTPIENPILPIKESPALYGIVGHILGDGSATKRKVPYYANTCEELRKEFIRDLQVFGKVKISNRTLTVPIITFPKAITKVLAHCLEVSLDTKENLPRNIFAASKNCKAALLRALFDDEGTCSANLAIKMNGEQLIRNIRMLTESLDITCGKITIVPNQSGIRGYSFRILNKDFEKFANLIGFSHPKKAENLKAAIRRRYRTQRCREPKEIESLVLNFLEQNQKARTIVLANLLDLTLGHMLVHLKRMQKEGKIKNSTEENKYFIWHTH
jgi:hypothetical protein